LQALLRVVNALSATEKLDFAGVWGSELGRFQRRAGTEYSDLVEALEVSDRLCLLSARYVGLGAASSAGVRFRYRPATATLLQATEEIEHDTPMSVIINCTGSGSLNAAGAAGLIQNMVDRSLVKVNPSARGLVLNDHMEAHDNIYVVGPLMSGNVIGGAAVWHMEHCGRIIAFSGVLANTLADRL
jgi:uncharacterized NAD(P)/FAD-binding protein YdhS